MVSLVALCLLLVASANAIPMWEGLTGRSSIGSLVPGASYLEAMGPVNDGRRTLHLGTPGIEPVPGNMTLVHGAHKPPPLFYVNQKQLWLLVNETSVFPVNVHNVTGDFHPDLPFQLVLGKKIAGVQGGEWRWQGTSLVYDLPGVNDPSTHGLFFHCILPPTYRSNVLMSSSPCPSPPGCTIMTLHSLQRALKDKFKVQ